MFQEMHCRWVENHQISHMPLTQYAGINWRLDIIYKYQWLLKSHQETFTLKTDK